MLTIEDGTGLSAATSYASVAEADAYVSEWYPGGSWTNLSDAQKETALRKGTRGLDMMFYDQWLGMRATENQALDFPRRGVIFRDNGYALSDTTLPAPVKQAAIELAIRYGDGTDPFADVADPALILEETIRIDVISESIKYAAPVNPVQRPVFPIIQNLLRRYIMPSGRVMRA